MSILALDQALVNTGIIVMDLTGKLLHHETFKVNKLRGVDRVLEITSRIKAMVTEFEPQIAYLEGVYGARFHVPEKGYLYYRIVELLQELRVPSLAIPPKKIKKFVTGNGNADKDMMRKYANKRWPITKNFDEHQIDAYGLAMLGLEAEREAA